MRRPTPPPPAPPHALQGLSRLAPAVAVMLRQPCWEEARNSILLHEIPTLVGEGVASSFLQLCCLAVAACSAFM